MKKKKKDIIFRLSVAINTPFFYIVNDHYLRAWLLYVWVWGEGEQRRKIGDYSGAETRLNAKFHKTVLCPTGNEEAPFNS